MTIPKILKSPWFYVILVLVIFGLYVKSRMDQLAPSPTIKDSPTSIIGFNHIGLSVQDLDKMVAFYQEATGFPVSKRYKVNNNPAANTLYGMDSIGFETAILKGPNMLLELTQFDYQTDQPDGNMPPQGPGMTHTCYQTKADNSGFEKFKSAGTSMLGRGTEPVDLGGYGVTYAYGHDPEGNMMELEQMSNFVIWLKIGKEYAEKNPMWMTQVAIMSHDVKRLTEFYEKVLGIEPYRELDLTNNLKMDELIDVDSVHIKSAWFMLDSQDKKMELMQYVTPTTLKNTETRKVTDFGYTYSFEVEDIQAEYTRLKEKGIDFLSEPQRMEAFWKVIARDIDGNYFSLRQAIDPNSIYSIKSF